MSGARERPVARYAVIHDGQAFQINLAGKNYGPYATRSAALRDAIDTARKAGESGYDAMVLTQGPDGLFRTEWRYTRAPTPPEA